MDPAQFYNTQWKIYFAQNIKFANILIKKKNNSVPNALDAFYMYLDEHEKMSPSLDTALNPQTHQLRISLN